MNPHSAFALALALLTVAACTSAAAADLPVRKAGLWEQTVKGDLMPTRHENICVDPESEAENNADTAGFMKESCSRNEVRKDGNTWTIDSDCTLRGIHTTGHSVITVSDDSYHSEATTTFDPPMNGKKSSVLTVDGKRLGPCQ